MESLILQDSRVLTRISQLAQEMHIPKQDVVKKAIDLYMEDVKKKSKLMSFAGILSQEDADDILASIKNNRLNKDMEIEL